MKKETFIKMKFDCIEFQRQNTVQQKNLAEWLKKAIRFIRRLREEGIPLEDININDYNSNTRPSVYLGKKRYSRLAPNDYKLALRD